MELGGNCWLKADTAHERAEAAFAEWFAQRRTAGSYSSEMAENFSNLLDVRPRFCGFVMPDGQPRFCRQPGKGEPLWYMKEDGISTARSADELENALPFSPIFTAENKN